MTAITLTPAQRSALRGLAHGLPVTVHIGQGGVTPAVLKEIDIALGVHGLIKVRVLVAEHDGRDAMLDQISEALFCAPVQHIGRMLVLWRARPQDAMPAQPPLVKASLKGAKAGGARNKLAVSGAESRTAGGRSGTTRSRGEGFEQKVRRPRTVAGAVTEAPRSNRPARSAGPDGFAGDRPRVPRAPRSSEGFGGDRPRSDRPQGDRPPSGGFGDRPRAPRSNDGFGGDRPRSSSFAPDRARSSRSAAPSGDRPRSAAGRPGGGGRPPGARGGASGAPRAPGGSRGPRKPGRD